MKKLLLILSSLVLLMCILTVTTYAGSAESEPIFDILDSHEDDPLPAMINEADEIFVDDNEYFLSDQTDLFTNDQTLSGSNTSDIPKTTGELEYTITGLYSPAAIQNFYIGTRYIYITQVDSTKTNGYEDVIISRCEIISSNTATFKDKMILKGFGHNQILDAFTHNGTMYLWVGCKGNLTAEWQYSLQLGRIQYIANSTINAYTDITRLVSLNRANTTGTSFGNLERIDAALSSDKTKLVILARNTSKDIQISYFDAEAINDLLDEKINQTSKYVTFYNNTDAVNACLFSCVISSGNYSFPNNSCQGIDLTNANSIYIAGGARHKLTDTCDKPIIVKWLQNNSTYSVSKEIMVNNTEFGKYSEIEGICIIGDKLMFGIDGYNARTTTKYIYSIDKNLLF